VPFTGGGISVPRCRSWADFVAGLEREADIGESTAPDVPPQELIRRANRAVRVLRAREPAAFARHVRAALIGEEHGLPAQTRALARLRWPLVLTTNYDDLFVAATHEHNAPVEVVGRSPVDCRRVLASLHAPSPPLLWALQGYIGGIHVSTDHEHRLSAELVVGHEEYRRVTYREVHFRRAFAEVFRTRSLLFVGSGLQETYLLELFSEVLEMYGPSARPNYALIRKGEVDADFLALRYETAVVEYDDHDDVPALLEELADTVESAHLRPARWSFAVRSADGQVRQAQPPELEIIAGALPGMLEKLECIAVSAGGETGYAFSGPIQQLLRHVLPKQPQMLTPINDSGRVARFGAQPVFAVRARAEGDLYDLTVIGAAMTELLDAVAAAGFVRVYIQLLAAGGKETDSANDWARQPFPARFSFAEMVRAFGGWRSANPQSRLQVRICLVDPTVLAEVVSGRLDVPELLSSHQAIRFWVEIDRDGDLSWNLMDVAPSTTAGEIAAQLEVPLEGWEVEVIPSARLGIGNARALADARDDVLTALGVVPGSTLRLRRAGTGASTR
jgi:hypothetical protein